MDDKTAIIQEQLKERSEQAKKDPDFFIDRFCYTFDPRLTPPHLHFRLFPFQKDLVKEVFSAIKNGYDLFIEKPRDMGVTYTILDVLLWFWAYVGGSNFLLGSRKQDYVDNTKESEGNQLTNKEESLFGKIEYTIRHLPGFMLPNNFNLDKDLTFMSLINPELGNAISGESANPNFSRSGRYKAILMDEFAFWENDYTAWGSTADSTNCRIVVTTPGIRPSTKAERLRFHKDGENIKVFEIDYSQDPRKTGEWESKERDRRSLEDFSREIMRNWKTSVKGRVYDEIDKAILGLFPFNPRWPLFISWDFGLDGTAIQWWQPNLMNGRMRIVDSFFFENRPIQYAFPLFGRDIDSTFTYSEEDLEAIGIISQLPSGVHYGDPDVAKRSYQSKDMTSTRELLESIGVYIQTNTEANQFYVRREKTKVMLQKIVEVNNTPRNLFWLESIQNSRYPQRSESSQNTSAITLPVHDRNSHHRTATEYFSVNYDPLAVETEEELAKPPAWYKQGMSFNQPGVLRRR